MVPVSNLAPTSLQMASKYETSPTHVVKQFQQPKMLYKGCKQILATSKLVQGRTIHKVIWGRWERGGERGRKKGEKGERGEGEEGSFSDISYIPSYTFI